MNNLKNKIKSTNLKNNIYKLTKKKKEKDKKKEKKIKFIKLELVFLQ